MQPLLFQQSGELADGNYLPGQYSFPYPVQLQSALLIARGGTGNLTLEVNGTLTAITFGLAGPATETEYRAARANLGLVVPANQALRWKITGGTHPASSP